jgi:hypothetical protein
MRQTGQNGSLLCKPGLDSLRAGLGVFQAFMVMGFLSVFDVEKIRIRLCALEAF